MIDDRSQGPPVAVGADGCKAGRWAAFLVDRRGRFRFELFPDTAALWLAARVARRVLLDVPIGLADAPRACDLLAKRLLGRCHSRVFLTPPRAAIQAADWPTANATSRRLGLGGISKQAWNIAPRICEVDALLRHDRRARRTIRECHPEVCFAALAGAPLAANKKTAAGLDARLGLLTPHVPDAPALLAHALASTPRSVLAPDDVLDALVAAVCAAAPARALRTIPARPPRDPSGLVMAMTLPRAAAFKAGRLPRRPC